mmetsp:Transcript_28564/g.61222  ORF Transcript_28564/g.61222 Transcript_28564/m.61222 type:complete len:325 (-) Transcript_28564:702-1676(-)
MDQQRRRQRIRDLGRPGGTLLSRGHRCRKPQNLGIFASQHFHRFPARHESHRRLCLYGSRGVQPRAADLRHEAAAGPTELRQRQVLRGADTRRLVHGNRHIPRREHPQHRGELGQPVHIPGGWIERVPGRLARRRRGRSPQPEVRGLFRGRRLRPRRPLRVLQRPRFEVRRQRDLLLFQRGHANNRGRFRQVGHLHHFQNRLRGAILHAPGMAVHRSRTRYLRRRSRRIETETREDQDLRCEPGGPGKPRKIPALRRNDGRHRSQPVHDKGHRRGTGLRTFEICQHGPDLPGELQGWTTHPAGHRLRESRGCGGRILRYLSGKQ